MLQNSSILVNKFISSNPCLPSGVVSAAEHLKNVANWLEALQKLQLGLGDPLGNPQVKQRTAWMTDKKSVARLLNDRY